MSMIFPDLRMDRWLAVWQFIIVAHILHQNVEVYVPKMTELNKLDLTIL